MQVADKTVVDALVPAASAIADGEVPGIAGLCSLGAAKAGRDSATPLRAKMGRASW